MKEKQFNKKLKEFNFEDGLIIQVYYALDGQGNVVLDLEGMGEEFNNKIKEIEEILKNEK
jgi:hypothetical protein